MLSVSNHMHACSASMVDQMHADGRTAAGRTHYILTHVRRLVANTDLKLHEELNSVRCNANRRYTGCSAMESKSDAWDEIKICVDTYTKSWNMIVTWFNWFFGINVAAMAYIVVSEKGIEKHLALPCCIFMSVCVCIGIYVSARMVSYCKICKERVVSISKKIMEEKDYYLDGNTLIAEPVFGLASKLIVFSLVWTLVGWCYIAAWSLKVLPPLLS